MHRKSGADFGIRVGDVIDDKYRVDRILGIGGMGVVVAAHHLRLGELVAIKLLLPEALVDIDAVRRFEHEARAAVKIKSEHVARIIDVASRKDGAPYIVMEYLEGEDLADRLTRIGPLPVESTVELLLQACEAIAEAHAIGIVHRDLKPANLFCMQDPDGHPSVKVLDFGISKFTRAGANSGLGMTKTTAMMGSPYYMSPEQMESPRAVDARTDIWSLGVVLYQLLTGEVPFAGETLPQVCVNVATRSPAPLRRYRPDVPNGLEAIAQRCLEKDPAQRYQSVAALASALARFGSRRAQTSLDRILRIEQNMEDVAEGEFVTHQRGPTDRPVTGPIPSSWGGTAKGIHKRTWNILGWSATTFSVVAVAATWARKNGSPSPASDGTVLITPSKGADSSQSAAAADPPAPSPQPSVASPPAAPLSTSTLSTPVRLTTPNRLPAAAAPPAELARPNPALTPATDQEVNPYLPLPDAAKSGNVVETCLLNLNAMPAATVLVDGTSLGFTPKMKVAVPVGEHRIRFHWAEGDRREVISCTRGETKTVAVRLSEPPPTEEMEKNPYR